MKKLKAAGKLRLNREAIRNLSPQEMNQANGAAAPSWGCFTGRTFTIIVSLGCDKTDFCPACTKDNIQTCA